MDLQGSENEFKDGNTSAGRSTVAGEPEMTPSFSEKSTSMTDISNHRQISKKSSRFEKWNVGQRYQLTKILGQGSYGEVAEAIDTRYVKKTFQIIMMQFYK